MGNSKRYDQKLTTCSSGHGTQREDIDGDEQDGQDEGDCSICILVLPVADENLKQSAQLIMKLLACLLMTTVSTIPPYPQQRAATNDISQCEENCISFLLFDG